MNTQLHAMTAGQVSDCTGATALLDSLPKAQWLLADRGYDANWFRDALQEKGGHTLYPGPENAEQDRQISQAPLQTRQPD